MGWTTKTEMESSNVVAFPVTERAGERLRAQRRATAGQGIAQRPVIYEGAWYHDEAVAEERTRKTDH